MRFEAFLKAKHCFKAPRLSALPHLPSIVRLALAQASLGGRLGAAFLLMQCVCGAVGAVAAPTRLQHQRPHRQITTSKKQKFLKFVRYAAITPQIPLWTRHTAPLPINTLKQNHWGGRGAGTPAPQLRLAPAKFGAGKI